MSENMQKENLDNTWLVFLIIFISGFSALLYEIILILLMSALVGATAVSAAIVLSVFLFGLAIGSLVGGKIVKHKVSHKLLLILSNILVGIYALMFLSILNILNNSAMPSYGVFWTVMLLTLFPTILFGFNIPLCVGILEKHKKHMTGFVYFSDTLGAVFGALLSGIMIIPLFGFHKTMFFGGFLNGIAALYASRIDRKRNILFILSITFLLLAGTSALAIKSENIHQVDLNFLESLYSVGDLYKDRVIYSEISPYQHIVIKESPIFGNQLFLDGRLQASDKDSLKYHEYLVLPAIAAHPDPKNILIIGDGDGGALYQALQYDFDTIDHVELDQKVIDVSRKYLPEVHRGAFDDKRINRHIMDARQFLKNTDKEFDVISIGLPDPFNIELASVYSKEFYQLIKDSLSKKGVVIIQTGSPYDYLQAQASILSTLRSVMPDSYPYIVPIASFEHNGFIIASRQDPRVVRNKDMISGKWYAPEDNDILFKLPKFFSDYYSNNTIPISTDENPVVHLFMQNNYYYDMILDDY